jgi:hypothetical protein
MCNALRGECRIFGPVLIHLLSFNNAWSHSVFALFPFFESCLYPGLIKAVYYLLETNRSVEFLCVVYTLEVVALDIHLSSAHLVILVLDSG